MSSKTNQQNQTEQKFKVKHLYKIEDRMYVCVEEGEYVSTLFDLDRGVLIPELNTVVTKYKERGLISYG